LTICLSRQADASEVHRFLEHHHYPHSWPLWLLEFVHIVRVEMNGELAGFCWFNRVADGTIEFHACVQEKFQGRWLSRTVVWRLLDYARELGAKVAVAYLPSPEITSIYERIGAEIVGPFALFHLNEEYLNGKSCRRPVRRHPEG
jgi:GNAT superfamily N-acetyltransferase